MNICSPTDHSITVQDGLRLHVREWGPRGSQALPVMCLPGLTRTTADFDVLAPALAGSVPPPRRVLALDSRGRGKSDYDRNPANYNLAVELGDLLAVLTALGIGKAIFVGTSRGGILTMLLGPVRPTAIAACVLNDTGPVIEPAGLARIKSYVGKMPQPASFEAAAENLARLFGTQFPRLTDSDWLAFAHRAFKQEGERIVPNYDPQLATILEDVDVEHPPRPLWKEFDSLARRPMMVIRGSNSDLLSAATVAAMRERRLQLEVLAVPDQGHAPLLAEPESIRKIAEFVRACDSYAD
ncbi:MAG TPA: alpha/beta hydrolase [Xanthobacteraceae bacterium]|jgi:pimeloyl-ACP methyl ester carboxylesterase